MEVEQTQDKVDCLERLVQTELLVILEVQELERIQVKLDFLEVSLLLEQLVLVVIQETLEVLDQMVRLDFLGLLERMEQLELQVPLDKRARLVAPFLSPEVLVETVVQEESRAIMEQLEMQGKQV